MGERDADPTVSVADTVAAATYQGLLGAAEFGDGRANGFLGGVVGVLRSRLDAGPAARAWSPGE